MSIGNLVNRERLAGKLDDAQAEKLRSLLASRFGPGEKSASGLMQAAKNLTNAGLLGHVTSAVVQAGDIALSVAAHGMLPTLKSAQQVITRKPGRISVKDVGLADHITEEIVGGEKKPMTVFGRQLSSAKFLQGVFKYSGFSLVDQLGKNISIGASFEKSVRLAQTEAGVAKLRAKYGEAYGPEFPPSSLTCAAAPIRKQSVASSFPNCLTSSRSRRSKFPRPTSTTRTSASST
jgi:hypothetical protein